MGIEGDDETIDREKEEIDRYYREKKPAVIPVDFLLFKGGSSSLTGQQGVAALILDTNKMVLVPITLVNTLGPAFFEAPLCAIGSDSTGFIPKFPCGRRTRATYGGDTKDRQKSSYHRLDEYPPSSFWSGIWIPH